MALSGIETFSLDFARAFGEPACRGKLRFVPEDFQVFEHLTLDQDNAGEHLYVQIQKCNQNTRWLAAQIAGQLQIPESAVAYSGLKDRRAVTTQWFSIHLPGRKTRSDERLLQSLDLEQSDIRKFHRQAKKLRRGMHQGNGFKLRVRDMQGDRGSLEKGLRKIESGVPNYFGEQRFGIEGQNLIHADKLLRRSRIRGGGRNGIYLSAARAYLFNQILSERVKRNCWAGPLPEEDVGKTDKNLSTERNSDKQIPYPNGALWGRGRAPVNPLVSQFEHEVVNPWGEWLEGLEHCGLQQERRALVLRPQKFSYRWLENDLELNFDLPAGSYATALLRELMITEVVR